MFSKNCSLYIHIPYCFSKCTYCDFFSIPIEKKIVPESYINALVNEISWKIKEYKVREFSSVYFGGGTPSLLTAEQVNRIFSVLKKCISKNSEVNFELNCDDVSEDFLHKLHEIGINRFSVGIQSLNEKVLKTIKRRSDEKITRNSLKILKKINDTSRGDLRISLDFIAGLPYYSKSNLILDLKTVIDMGFNHISLYSLTLEENTGLYKSIKNKTLKFDEEKNNKIWIDAANFLTDNGFIEYEISNFCLPGFESQHNYRYWDALDYLGAGSAAVQTVYDQNGKTGIRTENSSDIDKYCSFWQNSTVENDLSFKVKNKDVPFNIEFLDEKTVLFETLMTGFRTKKGICAQDFYLRFGKNIVDFLPDNKIKENDGYFSFTKEQMLFFNKYLVEILEKIDKNFTK
ncbi:MAG: radical SAM family heme chaperone HemW [Treponemataceae bacterium]